VAEDFGRWIDADGAWPFDADLRNFMIAALAQEFRLIYGRWIQGTNLQGAGGPLVMECSPLDTLSEIFGDVLDPVFAYTADGRYLFINATAAEFVGRAPLEVVGRHWRELGVPAEVMEPLAAKVAVVASTGRSQHYRFEATALRDLRMFDVSLSPLWTEARSVLAVLAIFHDVSEYFRPELGS